MPDKIEFITKTNDSFDDMSKPVSVDDFDSNKQSEARSILERIQSYNQMRWKNIARYLSFRNN